jgi:hypothetical protein
MYDFNDHLKDEQRKAETQREEFNRLKESGDLPEGISTLDQFLEQYQSIKAEKEAQLKAEKERLRKLGEEQSKHKTNEVAKKLKTGGFVSLDRQEIAFVAEVVGMALSETSNLANEKLALVEAALSDSVTYRYLTLLRAELVSEKQAKELKAIARSQAAMAKSLGAKLSDISSKAGGIRAGTTFAGLAAAKHLGEEMAEDFGGDE